MPSYQLYLLHHLLPECLHQSLLTVFLTDYDLPTDMALQEGLKEWQEVLLYNSEDVHLQSGLLFGEAVDAVRGAEDHHLHPQTLQTLPLRTLHLIEENSQRKDTDTGKEVEAEQCWFFFLSLQVPDAPA